MERRILTAELRALGGNRIAGTASVTYDGTAGSEYNLYGQIWERFAPGAFDEVLRKSPDVVATFNHDLSVILGRTPNTLRLFSDHRGLHYEVDLPDTTAGRDLYKLIERGDIRGSSFGFIPAFAEWSKDGTKEVRTIKRVKQLLDVGPVTFPAYGATTTGLRGTEIDEIKREREDWLRQIETQIRKEKLQRYTTI